MNGWKVLSPHRESCRVRHWDDTLQWSIKYPKGKEVFPKAEGSKLFFFKDKFTAKCFAITSEGE